MILYRTNGKYGEGHASSRAVSQAASTAAGNSSTAAGSAGGDGTRMSGGGLPGDIIYGARAIARHLFDDDSNRARRRVFNLWTFHRDREEQAGFFKLKGALCLSKSQWLAFHGLG